MTRKQLLFWSFCLILLIGGMMMVTLKWKGNSFYIRPYQAVDAKVKQRRMQSQQESHSNQPKAPGMSESDIKKSRGKGYSTY